MTAPGVSTTTSRRSRALRSIAWALAVGVTAYVLVAHLLESERTLASDAFAFGLVLTTYVLVAYVVLPWLWLEDETHHPALSGSPKVTHNVDGVPGDPLNVGLVGHRPQVIQALLAAGWPPADDVTLASSVKIVRSVLFHRPDVTAPVSALYVFGRRQDLAFEREVGSSASQRHHVRWWRADQLDPLGRPLWLGAVSFDRGVGLSHLTGQITHHIAPDLDSERDQLMADLKRTGQLVQQYQQPGVGPTRDGRNAGGDHYFTDGLLRVGVLRAADRPPSVSNAQPRP